MRLKYFFTITLLLLNFALARVEIIPSSYLVHLNSAKAKRELEQEKLKIRDQARKRLRQKISLMVAIRHGRKAYSRWLDRQKAVEEMEANQTAKESESMSGLLNVDPWLIKSCYWGLSKYFYSLTTTLQSCNYLPYKFFVKKLIQDASVVLR